MINKFLKLLNPISLILFLLKFNFFIVSFNAKHSPKKYVLSSSKLHLDKFRYLIPKDAKKIFNSKNFSLFNL